MRNQKQPEANLRKRKMLLSFPILLLPFITLGFWALGGGKQKVAPVNGGEVKAGLNLQLPDAHLKKDNDLDKMSYYEMAAADSDKLKTRIRNDPYFKLSNSELTDTAGTGKDADDDSLATKNTIPGDVPGKIGIRGVSSSETKVFEKLHQINDALARANNTQIPSIGNRPGDQAEGSEQPALPAGSDNKDKLEAMLHNLKQDNGESDTEMNQINAMLEKVMDIQHPERLNEKYKRYNETSAKPVFSVTGQDDHFTGFYTGNNEDSNAYKGNSFRAVVSDRQTLVNGAIIKLRLVTDIYINGALIPKDNFVFGKVSLNGERLSVSVAGIRYRNDLLPVAMSVYDMDGLDGIYIPGAIARDVTKQSADNALGSVALNSLDPSIGAQAAGAGIETAKTLISKKVKLVRVTVRAGYQVLLKNNDIK